MVAELDREATRLGVTRQSLIKVWIAEKPIKGIIPPPDGRRQFDDNRDDGYGLHDTNYTAITAPQPPVQGFCPGLQCGGQGSSPLSSTRENGDAAGTLEPFVSSIG